jgi:hypothetical protein
MFATLPWQLILGLSTTGILMALLSSLVGLRQKVEIPMWWGLYVIWIVIVLASGVREVFRTILFASVLAGLLHGLTQAILLEQYRKNNPWYADEMQSSTARLRARFVLAAVAVGAAFGAIVGGVAWVLRLL